jgi:hypothetical protein
MALASKYDDTHQPCNGDDGALPCVNIVFDLCELVLRHPHDEENRVGPVSCEVRASGTFQGADSARKTRREREVF